MSLVPFERDFQETQKLIPRKKNQSFPIAKLGSRKTQKIANPQKQTPAKI